MRHVHPCEFEGRCCNFTRKGDSDHCVHIPNLITQRAVTVWHVAAISLLHEFTRHGRAHKFIEANENMLDSKDVTMAGISLVPRVEADFAIETVPN